MAHLGYKIAEVTPEMANEWLTQCPFERQRNLRDHHVLLLALEMENGSFIPHSSIVFAELDGKRYLIDGQHRLRAIALYGRPVSMPVLELKASSHREIEEWYSSIDQGLKRTAVDAIRAQGLAKEIGGISDRQAGRLSGAVRQIASGFIDTTKGVGIAKGNQVRAARSNAFVSRLMREWADEGRRYFAMLQGGEKANMHLLERAPVIACALLTIRYRSGDAEKFWPEMADDDGLSRSDPRKRFLMWLRENKEKPANTARAFSMAWRAFLEGNELKLIRFDPTKPIDIRYVPLNDEVTRSAELKVFEQPRESPAVQKESSVNRRGDGCPLTKNFSPEEFELGASL
jgi:hypothetical protein